MNVRLKGEPVTLVPQVSLIDPVTPLAHVDGLKTIIEGRQELAPRVINCRPRSQG